MVGRRVLLLFLASGRDVRQILNTRNVQPGARVPLSSADHDLAPLDAIAGCEYVDDRIRLQE